MAIIPPRSALPVEPRSGRGRRRIFIDTDRLYQLGRDAVGDQIIEPIPARLGHPTPTLVQSPIMVPISEAGAPGYVYIHGVQSESDDMQGVTIALNSGRGKLRREDMIWGSHIFLRKRTRGGYIVDGLDDEANAEWVAGAVIRPQTSIVLSQIDIGLLQPTSPNSMRAIIGGGMYRYGTEAINALSLYTKDFTADVPAGAGEAVAILVEIIPGNSVPRYTAGATFDASLSHAQAFNLYYPQPEFGMLCGWIKLVNGMTVIQQALHIFAGQQVLTADSNTHALRDDYGNILLDDDDHVVMLDAP